MNNRMKKLIPALAGASFMALAGCSSTGGNSGLNAQAIAAYQSPAAAQELPSSRKRLAACIAREAATQRLNGASSVDQSAVFQACQSYELAYRTSVMSQVRPEWRRPEVLNNTADSATDNLYATILELFR